MSQERTEAIVLRGVDFSETSRIVTFLTPERGKLACMAAGVKRPKSELAALLDTFNRVELDYYWKDSRSVQKLASATVLDGYNGIKADLDKTIYGALALEMVYKVAHEDEPSEMLFAALSDGLASLAVWTGSVRAHACWQMIRLLSVAGYEPQLEEGCTGFDYDLGLVRGRADIRLSQEDSAALAALGDSRQCAEVAPSEAVLKALVRYAERHVESSFRSAKVIESMYSRLGPNW